MQNDKMDTSAVYTMFEEIKENQAKQLTAIKELQSQPDPMSAESTPALTTEDGEKIEMLTEKLDNVSEQLGRPLKHCHTIDFMGNWALIALVLAVGAFIASLWVINNQRQTLAEFRDNDLKYRYIQMCGEATPEDILRLRELFEFNRAPDNIKTIRRQVERYEQLILQQAENEARAKLNDEQAKQLKQKAETVKRGE
jgi:DNA-binding transcriptional MerR regulator